MIILKPILFARGEMFILPEPKNFLSTNLIELRSNENDE
jgi:hypothetical protein